MADLQDELHLSAAVESGTVSDHQSLSTLYHAALNAIARALTSDDERVSLRAAQVVFDHLHRLNESPSVTNREQVITIRYGEGSDDSDRPFTPSRPGTGPGVGGAFQSRRLWPALGQDGDGQDRGD